MGHTILLADKSITIQKIVELTFADEDFVIKSFSDGQAAIDAIPQLQPDIILADISLPGRNGYEICRALRNDPALANFSKTPVILLAGIYETMDEERARQVEENVRESGANDFLSKPFDPQLLISKVRYVISSRAEEKDITGPTRVVLTSTDEITGPTMAVFNETPAPSENFFTSPIVAEEKAEAPPDDGESTMMIPRSSLSQNIFAESLPSGEESPAQQEVRAPVDVQAVSPEYEPVFEADHEFASNDEAAADEKQEVEPEKVEYSELDSGDAFQGHQEVEFTMPENRKHDEIPPVILAQGEPFGEVFDPAPPPSEWATVSTSEEESPFGLPEPVAPPVSPVEAQAVAEFVGEPVEEVQAEVEAEIETETEGEAEVEQAEEGIEDAAAEDELVATDELAAEEELVPAEEMAAADYDDTWPGVTVGAEHQPVEDLFENEMKSVDTIQGVDEEAELVEDFSESEMEQPQADATLIAAPAERMAANVEITDELVDRIAERVAAKLSERVVSEIVWQVVPDLAERMIRRELEKLHSGEE